jgi:hypothetical protein
MLGTIVVYLLLALIVGVIAWWAIAGWKDRRRDSARMSPVLGTDSQPLDDLLRRG